MRSVLYWLRCHNQFALGFILVFSLGWGRWPLIIKTMSPDLSLSLVLRHPLLDAFLILFVTVVVGKLRCKEKLLMFGEHDVDRVMGPKRYMGDRKDSGSALCNLGIVQLCDAEIIWCFSCVYHITPLLTMNRYFQPHNWHKIKVNKTYKDWFTPRGWPVVFVLKATSVSIERQYHAENNGKTLLHLCEILTR